jgi:hypothetical protein
MSSNNVLVTGTPRSGTTLTCHLLNKLPDTVALHEPMKVKELAELKNHEQICRAIERFCDEQRTSIHECKRAVSKNVDGAVPDNPFGADRSDAGLRQMVASKSEIVVDKELSQDFMLVIKHPAAFTAVLEGLIKCFPVYAVIRNPLATLASWNSIEVNVHNGYAPAAERLDPNLKAQLAAIDDTLDRQIHLLGWFHEQFRRYLPERSIIRYESVIESGGSALSVVRPEAANLSEPLEIRNTSKLYDYQAMLRIGKRLLNSEGAYWEFYTKESVEHLLSELKVAKRGRRSPVFRFDNVSAVAQNLKALLNPEGGVPRGPVPDAEQHEDPKKTARRRRSEQKEKIKSKKRELSRIKSERRAAKEPAERVEHQKTKKRVEQEIFQLESELRAAKERRAENEPRTGALPDFVVIGAMKGGTSFLYHLLTQHPLVERASAKELHFFDLLFEEGVEWYRRCFPPPKWKEGRRTMTGEATPYLSYPLAPERVAGVIPQARLIALLRNPVDRAYSHYQQAVRKGRENRSFEEAIEAEELRALGAGRDASEGGERARLDDSRGAYLFKGLYVDQLLRWSEFFGEEQMLVLKSEDFFESPQETLKSVLEFLGLPDWEPEASEIIPKKRNKGGYERGMDPATRRQLEEYFEPHNQRLYDYLGADFGW